VIKIKKTTTVAAVAASVLLTLALLALACHGAVNITISNVSVFIGR